MKYKEGDKLRIVGCNCGHTAYHRLLTMGLIEGKEITIKTAQPFKGPYVIRLNGTELTIGRGLFEKIVFEKV